MSGVAYTSPWVPAEWISAHGLRPDWMRLGLEGTDNRQGVCPYASAMIEAVLSGTQARGVVVATTCDQMRCAAALLEQEARLPVFLLNVPSTCGIEAAGLYRDELARLGRFLVAVGGSSPTEEELAEVVLTYDRARAAVGRACQKLSARQVAEAILQIRRGETRGVQAEVRGGETGRGGEREGVPLAIVGGPLAEDDFRLWDLIERAGGHVVLDATEGGGRTLPAAVDLKRLREDPLEELAHAYFDAIPDSFRRRNDALYRWLGEEIAARGVRGILFRRYVWCDLWHAELARLKQQSPVPVLELDVAGGDADHGAGDGPSSRTATRVEAFLEMLR